MDFEEPCNRFLITGFSRVQVACARAWADDANLKEFEFVDSSSVEWLKLTQTGLAVVPVGVASRNCGKVCLAVQVTGILSGQFSGSFSSLSSIGSADVHVGRPSRGLRHSAHVQAQLCS